MFGLGHLEILVIGLVAVLLFGPRIPKVARSLGKGITSFKRGLRDVDIRADIEKAADDEPDGKHAEAKSEA